ncbi:MAG: sugar transferase, partial [Desulfobacteraceae bacterium]
MKRLLDVIFALLSLILLTIPMLAVSILIKLTSRGPVLYWSERVGRFNKIFKMPKFRSMRIDTPP